MSGPVSKAKHKCPSCGSENTRLPVPLARLTECSCCSVSAPTGPKNVTAAPTQGNHIPITLTKDSVLNPFFAVGEEAQVSSYLGYAEPHVQLQAVAYS